LGGETQIRDATRTFWPQIPAVRRGARGLGLRPEATLGLRLIPLKRGLAPPESCPVAPPAAPEAPRQESAPGRDRGAARASEAFPQVPWTAPSSRRPPSAPQSAGSAHLRPRNGCACLLLSLPHFLSPEVREFIRLRQVAVFNAWEALSSR
jgi:hypothetical protein